MADPVAARTGVVATGAERAELLLRVSHRLATCPDLSVALDGLAEIAAEAIGAERGSIFLNDASTGELYTRFRGAGIVREIRMMDTVGVAGHVFTTGRGAIIHHAYADERFNPEIDGKTGFTTANILCAPFHNLRGEKIGVAELLNKREGRFDEEDLALLEMMIAQGSIMLESLRKSEETEAARRQELEFLGLVAEVSSELKLGPLLRKLIATITRMLDAERSTLFLNDEKTGELYAEIGEGLGATQIRFPNDKGIAGTVFTSRKSVNIPHAYADLRFNPSFDRQTGFFTRSVLCVPVVNKQGKAIGVTQVLNKRGGVFTDEDERRVEAFTSQIAIGLENAKLFEDVQNVKNYNASVLESMSSAVVTVNEEGAILTCNAAGLRILRRTEPEVLGRAAAEVFGGPNAWLAERLAGDGESTEPDVCVDVVLSFGDEDVSANVTILPLMDARARRLGSILMIEDISNEKRLKSTMARYVDPSIADRLLQGDGTLLGGQSRTATILFADIRDFTALSEELGPQATVSLLNGYFTEMVECIRNEDGMLDKFIGDAIMAVFGTPLAHEDDPDRAVRCAIAMMRSLAGFNALRAENGQRPVEIGIGINTDTIVSGNIGSPKRMDYTVIGDGVNLASRLEGTCKEYGVRIVVSEHTFSRLKGTYRAREIDRVVVKGKERPIAIHEILDYHTEQTFPRISRALEHFRDGLESYRRRDWVDAARAFGDVLRLHPADRPARLYSERCARLEREPPGPDWDGTWRLATK